MGKKNIRPAARWASDSFESAFSSPLLLQFTSHSHVRHGLYLHQILCAASLDLLKIKNVANHKYLKSPGAGICTVFKQTFLIWYLWFFFCNSNMPLARLWVVFFFFLPFSFPLSGSIKFHVAPAQQQMGIANPTDGMWLQPVLTPSPPISPFCLVQILLWHTVIKWHKGLSNSGVAPCISVGTGLKGGDPQFVEHSGDGGQHALPAVPLRTRFCHADLLWARGTAGLVG